MDHFTPEPQVMHRRTPRPLPRISDDSPHLRIELDITDPDVIEALEARPIGSERTEFAHDALRIGVLALRHAGGRLDADLLQRETTSLLTRLDQTLAQHSQQAHERVQSSLKEYFDPHDGRFNERVQRLVAADGELVNVLREQVAGENSQLARTLLAHVGGDSPLMRVLDPQQSQGLLAALRDAVSGQLTKQSDTVLREFSLDNVDGALSRLVRELTAKHGDLTDKLGDKIATVVEEFSLDREDSALSKLVRNVETAQQRITREFSLDNDQSALSRMARMLETTQGAIQKNLTLDEEQSPLSRLKRELFDLIKVAEQNNRSFQQEVRETVAKLVAVREESQRGTRHGAEFEESLVEFVTREAQHLGDLAEATGNSTGQIRGSKVGDCVIHLGPDSPAAGQRIVFEAKQQVSYTLANAREEIDIARKNREANFGVFVFSKRTAPVGLAPFQKFGDDLFVVWDAEDPASDVYLQAAIITARALSFRAGRHTAAQAADFSAIEKAVLAIEKSAGNLDEIRKSAETIQNGATKILNRVRIDETELKKQVDVLRDKLAAVRESLAE